MITSLESRNRKLLKRRKRLERTFSRESCTTTETVVSTEGMRTPMPAGADRKFSAGTAILKWQIKIT